MRRTLVMKLSIVVLLIVIMTACGKTETPADTKQSDQKTAEALQVAFYVNGTLGDKGFHDSAQLGIDQAAAVLGIQTKTVQGGSNPADWGPGLESLVSSGKYDVIVIGSSQMSDIAKDLAGRYPEQKFIVFDEGIEGVPNIYSMTYSQREGSFLAGAFAALVTTNTELKGTNPDKVIGFIGGMDIPIINDFKSGYEQGAHYIDPDVTIISSYIGDFKNSPKGKELALAQYNNQQVDIIYGVAGGAGLGVLEAGQSVGKYSIGVDLNQNGLYPGSVLTSMLKNVDKSIVLALDQFTKGGLKFGSTQILGLKENGVGLAMDQYYEQYVPKPIQDKMKDIQGMISSGKITVASDLK
ncbi:BMP family lipoprotein [Paenibacillus tyrfis]|uniref:BMP family lipoprotein n=1 Tax=Paenibacillus tyrfis TaxID=1501230 RepID=UPI00209DA7E9|nr:BMP family ABC transporter substrate-binding protein [Paenibacillus tyrfis]MCP1312435.1 BMP family ABC transporter substrate-binding protein [Paenibacillus tyrfis]